MKQKYQNFDQRVDEILMGRLKKFVLGNNPYLKVKA